MAGNIAGTTNFSSISLEGGLDIGSQISLAGGNVSMTSLGRTTFASGSSLVVASGATVTFAGAQFSMRTVNAASMASIGPTNPDNMVVGFQLAASGMSLIARSGNTLYYFNSAASMAAP